MHEEKGTYTGAAVPPIHKDTPADIVGVLRRLPPAFPGTLVELMKWRGCTVEELAENALTSRWTISRLRNDADYESSMDAIVGVCVGLSLPPAIYPEVIRKAGHSFRAIERHAAYQQLLPQMYIFGWDILQFNEALAEWGFTPIGQVD